VALWRGREGLRHTLRVISSIVLVSVALGLIALIIIIAISNLETGARFAEVVGGIAAVIGLLSGGLLVLTGPLADPSVAPKPSPPQLPATSVDSQSPEGSRFRSAILRGIAVLALSAAFVVGALFFIPNNVDSEGSSGTPDPDMYGDRWQNLVLTGYPKPVVLDDGRTWEWFAVRSETTVTFSPGGGAKNDGLSSLTVDMFQVGDCKSRTNVVFWSFAADGHFLGDSSVYNPSRRLSLPDHVNEIELTMSATYGKPENCDLGLGWRNPGIVRKKPLAEPSASPS
jgi:hypothetical protein